MVKPFSWKLGLEGGILSGRETDEASPDIPATDARLEVLSPSSTLTWRLPESRLFGKFGELSDNAVFRACRLGNAYRG